MNVCSECRFCDLETGFCSVKKSWMHAHEYACSRFRLSDWEREARGLPPLSEKVMRKQYIKNHIAMLPGMDNLKKK